MATSVHFMSCFCNLESHRNLNQTLSRPFDWKTRSEKVALLKWFSHFCVTFELKLCRVVFLREKGFRRLELSLGLFLASLNSSLDIKLRLLLPFSCIHTIAVKYVFSPPLKHEDEVAEWLRR